MNKARQLALAGAAVASLAWATPAMAVTSTRVVITEDQQEVPETRIQLFDADTGTDGAQAGADAEGDRLAGVGDRLGVSRLGEWEQQVH